VPRQPKVNAIFAASKSGLQSPCPSSLRLCPSCGWIQLFFIFKTILIYFLVGKFDHIALLLISIFSVDVNHPVSKLVLRATGCASRMLLIDGLIVGVFN